MTTAFSFLLLASSHLPRHTHPSPSRPPPSTCPEKQRRGSEERWGNNSGCWETLGDREGRSNLGWREVAWGTELGTTWAVTHWRLLEAWEPSTPLHASVYSFFSLKSGGRGHGRTMNEVTSSSRMLWLHAVASLRNTIWPVWGLLQAVAAAAFPRIQMSSEDRTQYILAFPVDLLHTHSLTLGLLETPKGPGTTSVWGLDDRA